LKAFGLISWHLALGRRQRVSCLTKKGRGL